MKVSDIMQKQVDFVPLKASVREVSRLIFGRGINGVPVCKGKKIVGFVTEKDILSKFYPSVEEYMEDPVHSRDFESMEKNVIEILNLPVAKIMTKKPTTITEDSPLLKAQSIMFVNKVGRLPVIDSKGNLVGILSKGDIFNAIVGGVMPIDKEEGFSDWQARHYDLLMDWETRLAQEIPDLAQLFKKEGVRKIADIASSTGEHVIALGKKGFEAYGFEASTLMFQTAESKLEKLDEKTRSRVSLIQGDYQTVFQKSSNDFDAVIFMGNALPHILYSDKKILKKITKIFNPNKSLFVFQIVNVEKIMNFQKGLRDFVIRKSDSAYEKAHLFIGFYSKDKNQEITYSQAIFDLASDKWQFRGINSVNLSLIGKKEVGDLLKEAGFSKVSYYGGSVNGSLFSNPFDPLKSDYLNVVAKK